MPTTTFLDNNNFRVVYSDRRASQLVPATDPYWFDSNNCIDVIRNTLYEAGWQFVNPRPDIGLGKVTLASPYKAGDGFMNFSHTWLSTLPHVGPIDSDEVDSLLRVLLMAEALQYSGDGTFIGPRSPAGVALTTRALYQIPKERFDATEQLITEGVIPPDSPPGFRIFIDLVGGTDIDLPEGYLLNQVRGLTAFRESGL